jgi:cytochrome P450
MLRELKYANRRTRTDVIPLYKQLLGQRGRNQHLQDLAHLCEQIITIINTRRANTRDEDRNDMLDIVLHAKDPEKGEKLDDANIINQILTLLVAGSEISASTIAFALHHLSQNPHIADAARRGRSALARPRVPRHRLRGCRQTALYAADRRRNTTTLAGSARIFPTSQD